MSTTRFVRLRTLKMQQREEDEPAVSQRTALLFGTSEGALMLVQPLAEAAFRNLLWMHAKLCTELPHPCGLHPRAFRLFRGVRRKLPEQRRRAVIIDLDLICDRYPSQPHEEQSKLAVSAGLREDKLTQMLITLYKEAPYL